MVGRDVRLVVEKEPREADAVALAVADLTVRDDRGQMLVDDVSFQLRAGEMLGIAGVQGNGQTELVEAITGLRPALRLGPADGRGAGRRQPARGAAPHGVGHVPEDRQHDGLVCDFSVAENLVLDLFDERPYGGEVGLDLDAIAANGAGRVAGVRHPGRVAGPARRVAVRRQPAEGRRGPRAVARPLKLLIASQPTRGVDVGAMEFIHRRIIDERDAGRPVLIVSTELDEIAALADRIAVMYRGKIVGIVPPDTSREELGLLMAGGSAE